ncbi:MAG: hypothetical protein O3A65_05255 [Proteobacteria bacterium]|nr:hypothetical protein [Pseudomonadota bacterium]
MKLALSKHAADKKILLIFCIFLIFTCTLISCNALNGATPIQNKGYVHPNQVYVYNGDGLYTQNSEIKLTPLGIDREILEISQRLKVQIKDLRRNKFYLAVSPQQRTGGYKFTTEKTNEKIVICLKKPRDTDSVSMALTNPIALIESNTELSLKASYCLQ